jgi:hypothetical protein
MDSPRKVNGRLLPRHGLERDFARLIKLSDKAEENAHVGNQFAGAENPDRR